MLSNVEVYIYIYIYIIPTYITSQRRLILASKTFRPTHFLMFFIPPKKNDANCNIYVFSVCRFYNSIL